MRVTSSAGGPTEEVQAKDPPTASSLAITPGNLEKLARWVPKKEMALLVEICERARRDPDLSRPALLLCWAYRDRIARMLDQDPFPTVTRQIADGLEQLRARNGL